MKTLFLSIITAFLFTSAYACETNEINFEKNNLCVKVEWIVGPTLNEFNSLSVTLSNESTLKLKVIPWMVMAGGHEHGSRPVTINATSTQNYIIEKIYFMGGMMGDWFLRFQLIDNSGAVVEEVRSLVELAE
jgi:hypothetical protein